MMMMMMMMMMFSAYKMYDPVSFPPPVLRAPYTVRNEINYGSPWCLPERSYKSRWFAICRQFLL